MQEKYALVTGASDRIGKAIALELAQMGYSLILHYNRSKDKIEKVKHLVEGLGVNAETLQLNFLEQIDYHKVFQDLKNKGININILVNSASDFRPSSFEDLGSEMLNRQMKINFENAYLLTKAFYQVYQRGEIINFLDTKVEKNQTPHLDYLLSKKLFRDFTALAAVELAPHFKVNAIAPGLVLPPAGKDESYLLDLAKNIPLQTIGNMEEILKAFRFLITSKFITGQIIYVDGGDHLI